MRFGVLDHLDFGDKTDLAAHYESRLRFVEKLDRAGFYGFHITEHHCTPLGGAASPSVFLAAAAQRTARIRLGALVYALPTHDPLRLIEEISMLDQISGGRLDIGFGRGSVPFELAYFGVAPERAAQLYAQSLEAVVQGLASGRLRRGGAAPPFDDVEIKLRPRQQPHPPIWYGVHSPESAVKAARNGYNIVCNQATDASARLIATFKQTRAALGFDPDEALIGLHRSVVVAPTDGEATTLAERAYANFIQSFRHVWMRHGAQTTVSGRENSFAELTAVERGVAGGPATVARRLAEQMARTGANYCLMYLAFGDLSDAEIGQSVDLFAQEVMPAMQVSATDRSGGKPIA